MEEKRRKKLSKYLSKLLRHDPARLGLVLEPGGWLNLGELLRAFERHGVRYSRAEIIDTALQQEKPRFSIELIDTSAATVNDTRFPERSPHHDPDLLRRIEPDRLRIRANYGHSIPVDLDFSPEPPPAQLFHGTARQFIQNIIKEGLVSMRRQFVHLYEDSKEARAVGRRHGLPVLLTVRAGDLHAAGHAFYHAGEGIWLTKYVPATYLKRSKEEVR